MTGSQAERFDREYLQRREANRARWATQAQLHGTELAATASTAWVRNTTLRRLRRLLRPTDRFLEIGCGNGNLVGPLGAHGRAFGVDITAEMLQVARANQPDIRGLARSDAACLPFHSASFDLVYTSRCLINLQDPAMQAAAVREILRIVKPDGTVVLSENFKEPVERMNRAKERFGSGPPDLDEHNLRLDFDRTLAICREHGWIPRQVRGFTLASFAAHVVIGRLTRRRGGRVAQRVAAPFLGVLARIDDAAGDWLPQFGKDTTITLQRTASV